ncbi:Y057-like protein [Mya arenaria]|uniref:Chloride channel CLIC-like protein 1 n=1 Tax=Mya arenaria TaxID=6604 RepID=A0ABY7F860_MYAAR|nr:uncharacterized protein LOC128206442 [Mya arenaria]WAR17217.1 Y057-like protein [Mya arenaria]
MAPDRLFSKSSTRLLFFGLFLSLFVLYIGIKINSVVSSSKLETQSSWWSWLFAFRERSTLSLTDPHLYSYLSTAIQDDLASIWRMCCDVFDSLVTSNSAVFNDFRVLMVFLASLSIILLSNVVFCYGFMKKSKKKNDQMKNCGTGEGETCSLQCTKNPSSNDRLHKNMYRYSTKKYVSRWLIGVGFMCFLLSIPWEFVRLYQSMVAEKVTQMNTGIPVECMPDQMTILQSVQSWLRWHFSWSPDPCLQYHKALLVDPVWHVSPLMVLSSAFSHCILHPCELLLGGLGRSLRVFFSEIPSPWQLPLLIIIVCFLLLIVIMCFGYRLHLPLLFKIEPKTPVYIQVHRQKKYVKLREQQLNFSIESSPSQNYSDTFSNSTDYSDESQM